MYKALCVAVLLLPTFVLGQGNNSAASAPPFPSPLIVAKAKLVNQTAPIQTATIFTPKQDGLYRWSVYATITTADANSQSNWYVNLFWTDDVGAQRINGLLVGLDNVAIPFVQEFSYGITLQLGGPVTVFEAKAGQPITYSVLLENGPTDNSAYSLYYTLERLE